MTDKKPDYSAVWNDLKKKLIAIAVILGALGSILTFIGPIGDFMIGRPVQHYTEEIQQQLDSTIKSYNSIIKANEIEKELIRKEFAKSMELICTILKGELKKHRVEGTDKFVYETNGINFEGYYYEGEYYYFQEIDFGGYIMIHPWSANYNSTLEAWGYVDDHGVYHEIKSHKH